MCSKEPQGLFLSFWVELRSSPHRKEQLNGYKFQLFACVLHSEFCNKLSKPPGFFPCSFRVWVNPQACHIYIWYGNTHWGKKTSHTLVYILPFENCQSAEAHYHFHLQLKDPPKFIRTALSRAGFIRQQLARDNSSQELPDKTAASVCVYTIHANRQLVYHI